MAFDLLVKGGFLVDPANDRQGRFDVGLAGGRVAAVEPDLGPDQAREVYDGTGKLVLPGLVDTHVHLTPVTRAVGFRMLARAGVTCALDCAGTIDEIIAGMARQGSGVIVQINSKSGKKGSFKNSAYASGKFGGIGLTQSLALEFAEQGIRINSICPGNLLDSPLWVDSLYAQYAERWGMTEQEVRQKYVDQVPMKRGCTYEDVANVMVFLCSDESSYMTGQAINVTGGQEMR